MIVGERILEISGHRAETGSIKGLNLNIGIDEVKEVDGVVEIIYTYTADYEDKFGLITIKGVLMAKEEDKLTKEIVDTWKRNKKIPDAYAELVLSAINYTGSANGTLLARVLGLTAPLIQPKIQVSQQATGSKK